MGAPWTNRASGQETQECLQQDGRREIYNFSQNALLKFATESLFYFTAMLHAFEKLALPLNVCLTDVA